MYQTIGTFVGITIFLVVELLLAAQLTETAILQNFESVVLNIEQRFKQLVQFFKATSIQNLQVHSVTLQRRLPQLIPINNSFRSMRDIIVFANLEPAFLFRPPSFPQAILQGSFHYPYP